MKKIAIIDSGAKHADFGYSIYNNGEFVTHLADNYNNDILKHGSLVEKIYRNFCDDILIGSYRVFFDELYCGVDELIYSIKLAIKDKVDLINLSCGIDIKNLKKDEIKKINSICKEAIAKNILIVAAQNENNTLYPGLIYGIYGVSDSKRFNSDVYIKNRHYYANGSWYFLDGNKHISTSGASFSTAFFGCLLLNKNIDKEFCINNEKIIHEYKNVLVINDFYTLQIIKNHLNNIKFDFNVDYVFYKDVYLLNNIDILINGKKTATISKLLDEKTNLILLTFDDNVEPCIDINYKNNFYLFGDYNISRELLTKMAPNFIKNDSIIYYDKFVYTEKFKKTDYNIVFVNTGNFNDMFNLEYNVINFKKQYDIKSSKIGMNVFHRTRKKYLGEINFYYYNILNDGKEDYQKRINSFLDKKIDRIFVLANINDKSEEIVQFVNFIELLTGICVTATFLSKNSYDQNETSNLKFKRIEITHDTEDKLKKIHNYKFGFILIDSFNKLKQLL